jgi:hypothetical protein
VGGSSAPPFDTLNLGRGVGDDPGTVRANRRLVLAVLGRILDDQVEAAQVHGSKVAVVGHMHRGQTIKGVDALITRAPSVVLAMHGADCVPVLLADPARGVVAAVHAGWRGTAAGVSSAAVAAMVRQCSSQADDLVAAIGPAIGPCCYEVDRPVFQAFAPWPWRDRVFNPLRSGRWMLDLWNANRQQLIDAGLRATAVYAAEMCTACHSQAFFSHRRDRITGRMVAHVALPAAPQVPTP